MPEVYHQQELPSGLACRQLRKEEAPMCVHGRNTSRRSPNTHLPGMVGVLILQLLLMAWRLDAQTLPLQHIKLPPGFEISIYASGVENARSMALSPNGTVFVGSRSAGKVYAVVDRDG